MVLYFSFQSQTETVAANRVSVRPPPQGGKMCKSIWLILLKFELYFPNPITKKQTYTKTGITEVPTLIISNRQFLSIWQKESQCLSLTLRQLRFVLRNQNNGFSIVTIRKNFLLNSLSCFHYRIESCSRQVQPYLTLYWLLVFLER